MKIKIATLVLALLVALVGCGEQKMNKVMPKAATTDAVYSAKASQYLDDALGTPKAKKIELTYWNEKSNPDTGYLSLVVDGVEKIRPIDNYGGVNRRTASTDGFKFVFENGTWRAYVAEADIETHGEHPQEFYNEMTGILRRY